ncbi:MAG: diacylglycerol kinase family lipid kinase [Capsulimonadales bacterium]|nr:diacylglycerol kinase family lipid kinase [Capsulimonadales bacterium]
MTLAFAPDASAAAVENDVDIDEDEVPAGNGRRCVTVIFNPVSGQTDPDWRSRQISEALARHGYTCQFIATSEERDAGLLATEAIRDGVDLLAVSGGDGTVMAALSALVGTEIPIAILPAGTGNLLSVNLGIPMGVPEAVEVALSGRPYRLDLARTPEGRFFAVMGGIGLDGRIIEEADRSAKKRLGVLAYFLAAFRNLANRPASVLIYLEDRPPIRRRAKSVLIGNMGKMTGGLEALPTASPNDGLLDIAILKPNSLAQWLRLFWFALRGRSQEAPELEVYQARRVRIRAVSPHPIQFDGEQGGYASELAAAVVPRAVSVLLPEESPAARDAVGAPAQTARKAADRRLMVAGGVLLFMAAAGWLIRAFVGRQRPIG